MVYWRVFVFLGIAHFTFSANRINVAKRFSEMSSLYQSPLYKRSMGEGQPSPEQLLDLGKDEGLTQTDAFVTAQGTVKEKLQETYKGVPVSGNVVVLEQGLDGEYIGASGQLLEGLDEDIDSFETLISIEEALTIACEAKHLNTFEVEFNEDRDVHTVIDIPDVESDKVWAEVTYHLSFLYTDLNDNIVTRPTFIIDAHTGEIIEEWEGLTTYRPNNNGKRYFDTQLWNVLGSYRSKKATEVDVSFNYPKKDKSAIQNEVLKPESDGYKLVKIMGYGGNNKTGIYEYGTDWPALEVWKSGEMCLMENEFVRIIHLNGTHDFDFDENRTLANDTYMFECDKGADDLDLRRGGFSQINDAYFFSNVAHDMYVDWLKIPPLNTKIVARVHFGEDFPNAFWDGFHTNFGDGDAEYYPWAVIDMVAHEISHGFTEQHSGLIYTGQSGGINEAFSDIAGVAIEDYLKQNTDWYMAYDLIVDKDEPLRYMITPSEDGRSMDNYGEYCDGADPHHSSGIINRAFYKLTQQSGWNVRKGFETFALANRMYWTKSASFQSAACGLKSAAKDLGYNASDVEVAFEAVGITPCGKKKGIDGSSDISIGGGEIRAFAYNLKQPSEQIRVETFQHYYWKKKGSDKANLTVMAPDGTAYHDVNESHIFYIDDPSPGTYIVLLQTEQKPIYKWSINFVVGIFNVNTEDHLIEKENMKPSVKPNVNVSKSEDKNDIGDVDPKDDTDDIERDAENTDLSGSESEDGSNGNITTITPIYTESSTQPYIEGSIAVTAVSDADVTSQSYAEHTEEGFVTKGPDPGLHTLEGKFTIPSFMIDYGERFALRCALKGETGEYDYGSVSYIELKHGSPVNVTITGWHHDADYWSVSKTRGDGDATVKEILICNPKSGPYFLFWEYYNNSEKDENDTAECWIERLLIPE